MKGSVIALGEIKERLAAAYIVDGKLTDFLIDSEVDSPGTIYRGIADRPIKGAGGIFLKLPEGTRAYLRQAKNVKPGDRVNVQVTGYAEPGKAIPVTSKIIFKSRYAIVTPGAPGLNISRSIKDEEERVRLKEIAHEAELPEGAGLILRSLCEGADDDEIAMDISAMAGAAQMVLSDEGQDAECLLDAPDAHSRAWSEWPAPDLLATSPDAFENYGVLDALDEMVLPRVSLDGASAFIEPTRALVAVDVNTGGDGSLAAGLKANMALARDLPRQLRIRGLGGQITLDLAPMPKKDRRNFEQVLKSAFRSDPVDTALAGWTPLGHFELQRKRERSPIAGLI